MTEVSLDQVVEMCKRAAQECARRTERFLTEVDPSPAVAKSVTAANHQRRRDEAYDKCMDTAASVLAQCPEPGKIRELVAETEAARKVAQQKNAASGGSGSGSVVFHEPHFQLRRCETAVASFVNVLFAVANAPTRYALETKDFHEQRKQEKIGAYAEGTKTVFKNTMATKNLPPGMTSGGGAHAGMGGGDSKDISEIVAQNFGGGQNAMSSGGAWMDQRDEDGIPIRPGTGHLTKEQRRQLEELANRSDPGQVKVWGGK